MMAGHWRLSICRWMDTRKISHCLLHAHLHCGQCAAEAASLVTTTALVAKCASNNLANKPHSHFSLCTQAHFLHLLASRNGSPVTAAFNGIQRPMRVITEWAP